MRLLAPLFRPMQPVEIRLALGQPFICCNTLYTSLLLIFRSVYSARCCCNALRVHYYYNTTELFLDCCIWFFLRSLLLLLLQQLIHVHFKDAHHAIVARRDNDGLIITLPRLHHLQVVERGGRPRGQCPQFGTGPGVPQVDGADRRGRHHHRLPPKPLEARDTGRRRRGVSTRLAALVAAVRQIPDFQRAVDAGRRAPVRIRRTKADGFDGNGRQFLR